MGVQYTPEPTQDGQTAVPPVLPTAPSTNATQDTDANPVAQPQGTSLSLPANTETASSDEVTSAPPVQSVSSELAPAPQEKTIDYEHVLVSLREKLSELHRKNALLAKTVEEETRHREALEKDLAPILERERTVSASLKELNNKERMATVSERRVYEEKRWKQVEEWYAVNQEKWKIEESMEAERDRAALHAKEHAGLSAEEAFLAAEIARVIIAKEKAELTAQLERIHAVRIDTEHQLEVLQEKRAKTLAQFDAVRTAEADVEKKEEGVAGLLAVAKSLTEEKALAHERYMLEQKRHEAEVKRWDAEDEIARLGGDTVASEKILSGVKEEEGALLAKLAALETAHPESPDLPTPSFTSEDQTDNISPSTDNSDK